MGEAKPVQKFIKFMAVQEKETARTVRFEEVTPPGEKFVIGYLYIQKAALARIGNPAMVTITVEPGQKGE